MLPPLKLTMPGRSDCPRHPGLESNEDLRRRKRGRGEGRRGETRVGSWPRMLTKGGKPGQIPKGGGREYTRRQRPSDVERGGRGPLALWNCQQCGRW